MKNAKNLKDKWFYVPVFILLVHFIYRLVDQAKLISYFPLDYFNDMSSYMAQLHFLKVCGFLSQCDFWYNGFITFQVTPPGWFLFALPFYYLFGDVKIATYSTMVLSFILAFLVIYIAGKHFNISKVQRVAFFSFMFMTALSVGSFIRLGRVHELFSWVWFLVFAFLVLYYKDREFDRFSLFIIPSFGLVILSYLSVGVLASLLFLGLFLVKDKKEKFFVVLYFLSSLLIASFWLIPFAKNVFTSSIIPTWVQGEWLWEFTKEHLITNLAALILPLVLFFLFYLFWMSNNMSRRELLFFFPVLILNLAYFLRITPLIPIIKNIFPDPYLTYFLFFSLFFLFKINYSVISKSILRLLPLLLMILSLISVSINLFHTQQFFVPDKGEHRDINNLLQKFDGSFLLFGDYPTTIYSKAVYSYAPIYYDLKTPLGFYPEIVGPDYLEKFNDINLGLRCDVFSSSLREFNTTYLIGYNKACDKFDKCGFEFLETSGDFCLYAVI